MKAITKYIKFFVSLGLFFFGSLLQLLPIYIFQIDYANASDFTQTCLTIFSNIIIVIILLLMYRKDIIKGIKDLKEKKGAPLGIGFNYWFLGLMIMAFSNFLISLFNQGGTSTNEESIRVIVNNFPVLALLSVAIISPMIEELVYRKAFRDIFENKWIYLFTSGVIFGGLHVFLSPINSFVDYLYLIPYCSMGVAFAYMYYKTNNILVPITMHIMHNTLNVVSTLLLAGAIIC